MRWQCSRAAFCGLLALANAARQGTTREQLPHSRLPERFVGVNLGGWFVLESWIYPQWWQQATNGSVPDGQGEWQFCETLGPSACSKALQQHWDSWVTQADLQALASAGVTHVRIPVGYWILGEDYILPSEPYVAGGWPFLLRALGWLHQLGMGAIIDLHGAPGSQNGHDNSGCTGPINWTQPANIARTVEVLRALAQLSVGLNSDPATAGVVVGIELLNEPWTVNVGGPISMPLLQSFILNATQAVLDTGFSGFVLFPDGWDRTWSGWQGFLVPPAYPAGSIYMDSHIYHCFGGYNASRWGQVAATCTQDAPQLAAQNGTVPVIVGEFSSCMPNGPAYPFNADDVAVMRAFFEAQMSAYGAVVAASQRQGQGLTFDAAATSQGDAAPVGAFFWNFKTESSYDWSFLAGLQDGYVANTTATPPGASWMACD